VPITLLFCGMLLIGYSGMQRRLYNLDAYAYAQRLLPMNQFISFMAFTLFTGQIFFDSNFIYSVFRGRKASENPWEVGTLEWQISSPPPHHNFDVIPNVLHGPHEFNNPEVMKKLGKDWLSQTEEIPLAEGGYREAPEIAAAGE
jgi:cytochrome c oxidase subunit 1